MPALNIQIEVPNSAVYDMEELKRKLTAYAKTLIVSSNTVTQKETKRYNHETLAGIFVGETDDLRKGYINDKYEL